MPVFFISGPQCQGLIWVIFAKSLKTFKIKTLILKEMAFARFTREKCFKKTLGGKFLGEWFVKEIMKKNL
jgi:hypothetical protein